MLVLCQFLGSTNMPMSDHSRLLLQLFILLGHQFVFSEQHTELSPTRNIFPQTVLTRKALHQSLLCKRTFTSEALYTTSSLHQRPEGETSAPETFYTEQVLHLHHKPCTPEDFYITDHLHKTVYATQNVLHYRLQTVYTTILIHRKPFTPCASKTR